MHRFGVLPYNLLMKMQEQKQIRGLYDTPPLPPLPRTHINLRKVCSVMNE